MCGFSGFLSLAQSNNIIELLQSMGNTLAHRGPNDCGLWRDNEVGIVLAHRRLSIVVFSPAVSGSGRYVLAFNGEIYNHLALRAEFEKISPSPSLLKGGA